MSKWYVVWCKTGNEDSVAKRIRADDVKTLVPKGKIWYYKDKEWELKERALLPGYVFTNCDMNAEIYYRIRKTSDVIGWLGSDSMWPTELTESEIENVIKLDSGEDPKKVLKAVKLDKHKRKGSGTITLCGEERQISFALDQEKQPDETKVDKVL